MKDALELLHEFVELYEEPSNKIFDLDDFYLDVCKFLQVDLKEI